MLVGHFAIGLIGKRAAPKVSLGTLTVALWTSVPWTLALEGGLWLTP